MIGSGFSFCSKMLHYAMLLNFALAGCAAAALDPGLQECFPDYDGLLIGVAARFQCRCTKQESDRVQKALFCTFPGNRSEQATVLTAVADDVKILTLEGRKAPTGSPPVLYLSHALFVNKTYREIHVTSSDIINQGQLGVFEAISSSLLVLNISNCKMQRTNLDNVDGDSPPLLWKMKNIQRLHFDRVIMEEEMVPSAILRDLINLRTLSMCRSNGSLTLSTFLEPVRGTLQDLELFDSCFEKPGVHIEFKELTVLNLQRPLKAECIVPYSSWMSNSQFSYADFPKLERLLLGGHHFNDADMAKITNASAMLRNLDLTASALGVLKEQQFSQLTGLKILTLHHSSFLIVAPKVFEGPGLDELDLSGITIPENSQIDSLLAGLTTKRLMLTDTTLTAMDFSEMSPTSPELLDLSNSANLTLSAAMFKSRTNLQTIRISGLQQQDVPENLLDSVKQTLKAFALSQSNVTSLPANLFANAKVLEDVNLSLNELQTLPQSLATVNTLLRLDVSKNKLQKMSEGFVNGLVARLKAVDSLNLRGNPWNCTSEMCALYKWAREEKGRKVVCGTRGCPECVEQPYPLNAIINDNVYDQCLPTTAASPDPAASRSPSTGQPSGDSVASTAASSSSTNKVANSNNKNSKLTVPLLVYVVAGTLYLRQLRS